MIRLLISLFCFSLSAFPLFSPCAAAAADDPPKYVVGLKWTDNSDNEEGFAVERSIDEVSWIILGTVAPNVTTFSDDLAVFGLTYAWRVRAFNPAGDSPYSPWARATIPFPPELPPPPAAPTGLLTILPDLPPPPSRLVNISTRGEVGAADAIMIGGFSIVGTEPMKVLLRAIGPSLAAFGVPGVLADPNLELIGVTSNDNWSGDEISDAAAAVSAFPLTAGSKDAAIIVILQPGTYTVHVTGVNGATGIALFEAYSVPVKKKVEGLEN